MTMPKNPKQVLRLPFEPVPHPDVYAQMRAAFDSYLFITAEEHARALVGGHYSFHPQEYVIWQRAWWASRDYIRPIRSVPPPPPPPPDHVDEPWEDPHSGYIDSEDYEFWQQYWAENFVN